MIRAGTARRSAGSAVSSRRYAGLAIDCASPLIESASRGRTRRFGARHAAPPFGLSPETTRPKRCAASLRITCYSNRWRLFVESPKSIFLVNVSTEICIAAFCTTARQFRSRINSVESGATVSAPELCNLRLQRARAATMSPTSRDSFGAAAIRRSAASARARRPASSARQLWNAVIMRAATCGLLGSSASTVSATKS